jgi:tRNA-splicing ligase RtcB
MRNMDRSRLKRLSEYSWQVERREPMRVNSVIFGSAKLIDQMDDMVLRQISNVASLPGIAGASYALPDAHWGYGFPIGGVGAFEADRGGVVCAGGVGFDIACGVRTCRTGLKWERVAGRIADIADSLFKVIPAGLGSTGSLKLKRKELDDVLSGGAEWAVQRGYGLKEDLEYIEKGGVVKGASCGDVSDHAKDRQLRQMGTLGSGNHYLEIQRVERVYDVRLAEAFGISEGDVLVSIHCGSRGLGHQIGTDYLKRMVKSAKSYGINLPEKELACAPIESSLGQSYLGAMVCGMNCAMANRQVLTELVRRGFSAVSGDSEISVLYDVSHNTCQVESHRTGSVEKEYYVHRKGATRAFGPGHYELPLRYRKAGQPVLIGGSMGTASYIMAGAPSSESAAFSSACHGAGRNMSRKSATKKFRGSEVVNELKSGGILIRSRSMRGVAEEAPGAYKDIDQVVDSAARAKLAVKVARLLPMACVKG